MSDLDLEIPFRRLGQNGGEQTPSQKEAFMPDESDEDEIEMGLRVRKTVENSSGMQRAWQAVALRR